VSRRTSFSLVPSLIVLLGIPHIAAAFGGPCGGCMAFDYRLSYDTPSSPLPNGPGDLLTPTLGLCAPIGSDIDAFTYTDNACCFDLPETTLVLYSVDRLTSGLPGSPIRLQDDCNGAAGDVFGIVVTGTLGSFLVLAPCFLVCDAPNLGLIPDGAGFESDLDALDINRPCPPPPPSYTFSEWGSSAMSWITADSTVDFMGPFLDPSDDIDALNIDGTSDAACIALSLGPGSPTLDALFLHPGDVLCTATGGTPIEMFDHLDPLCMCDLGTEGCPNDNLDALWFVDPGQRYGYCIIDRWNPVTIHQGFEQIEVDENRPILWVNSVAPGNPQPPCPLRVEVDAFQLFIEPNHSAGIPGLPANAALAGGTSYPFVVRNAFDPSDSATGVIIVYPAGTTDAEIPAALLGTMPVTTRLVSVMPNPARGSTGIVFDVPAARSVRVDIVDVQGRRVREIAGGDYGPGRHGVEWDGLDDDGARVAAGVYFVRLQSRDGVDTRRVTILR